MKVCTPNLPSAYASGFHLVQTTRDPGKTEAKCAQVYDALPCALGLLLKFKSFHINSHLTSTFIDEINSV